MSTPSPFRRAVKWAYVMHIGSHGFTAGFTFLLALLLGPHDFGLVALGWIYILFIQIFLDQGFVAALIQRKRLRPGHLHSVFWLAVGLGVVLTAIGIAGSGWWAARNGLPELARVILWLSLAIPIESLTVVQKAFLQRRMQFKSLSILSNVSVLAGGCVGLGMAFAGYGVWSLVGLRLTEDTVALALFWRLSAWRPRWMFSIRRVKQLLRFSVGNLAAKLGVFTSQQADAAIIGLFFGPAAVGLFRLADRLVSLALRIGVESLQIVSFPQLSSLQGQPEEFRRATLACIRVGATVAIPTLAAIAVTSDLLLGVLGEKWLPAAGALKVLCVLGMITSLELFTNPILQSLARPHWLAVLVWTRALVIVSAVWASAGYLVGLPLHRQVAGIALVRLAVGMVLLVPILRVTLGALCRVSAREFFAAIAPALTAAGGVWLAAGMMRLLPLGDGLAPVVRLLLTTAVAGATAAGILVALDRDLRHEAGRLRNLLTA